MSNLKVRSLVAGWIALALAAAMAIPETAQAATRAARKPAKPVIVLRMKAPAPGKRPVAVPARAVSRLAAAARVAAPRVVVPPRIVAPRLSYGQLAGLHAADDPLELESSVALVMDQDTNEVLFSKNPNAVLPIASITKLMTALVVTEARLPLDDMLSISEEDVDTEEHSRSLAPDGRSFAPLRMTCTDRASGNASHLAGCRAGPGG